MTTLTPVHSLGTHARILLSGVFGPYAQNDEYGSRTINPMELYQNQVTRVQGGFSLRMFHRSFGLMMIQSNLNAPCTLLDFPSLDRFVQEIRDNQYDIVGISAIIPNVGKVKKMCELVREHLPGATIVIGGHIANKEELSEIIDADHIVKGEGVRWFQKFLGQNETEPIRHPLAYSAHGTRTLGLPLHREHQQGNTAAMLIPSVGCPVGCNFCSTSALFGGKGNFVNFYETGDALFAVMCDLEAKLKVTSFFVMDENFLLHRSRALRLMELMASNQKSWSLYVFSSARVLQSYTIDQLVGLGISWVWMGLEGQSSQYRKLRGVDTYELVQHLKSHGIRVLGSSIIGLEEHTPENIDQVIEDAIRHDSDFHQFMLYTPIPGTPLYDQHRKNGSLLSEAAFPLADTHGQYRFNFHHPHIHQNREEGFLLKAFQRDFEVNGPSLARLIRTLLTGWQRYKNHSDSRIRNRFAREAFPLRSVYAGAVWAMKTHYRNNRRLSEKLTRLLRDIYHEFGWGPKMMAPLIGRYLYITLKREEKRLAKGWTYEPETFCEKNPAAIALENSARNTARRRTGNVIGFKIDMTVRNIAETAKAAPVVPSSF
ncbi:MAG: cobalamin-dependent protein [Desulfobacterales bacterium]|nr:cobalamin-dependent protein [Desulfobacterales bacterium]